MRIMEPVSRIDGFSWPTSGEGEPSAIAFIEHVSRLAISLPGGRTTSLTGRAVILQQRDGVVTDVTVPISTELQPFRRAREELGQAMVSLELIPESEVTAALNWEDGDAAGLAHAYRIEMNLDSDVKLYPALKADPLGQGWLGIIEFSMPARRTREDPTGERIHDRLRA